MKKLNESKESKAKRAESLGLPLQIEQKKRKAARAKNRQRKADRKKNKK